MMPAIAGLLVALLLLWLGVNLVKSKEQFFNVFFIGLTNGAVYALVALGYTLVYGILELINFAHGDVFMLGGMISATFILSVFGLGDNPSIGSLVPAIIVSLIAAMVIFALRSEPERVAAAEVASKSPGEAPRYSSGQIGSATVAGGDLLWQRSGA